tara:strand:+ start:1475 stop:1633 length:159 start_codon:yes stop_codon:yes gene_type:complete
MDKESPEAPDQLLKIYSEAGVAIIEAISPSLYCLFVGDTVPAFFGFTEVVKV